MTQDEKIDKTKCEEKVFYDTRDWHGHQCTRKLWKDGYCKTHHPDAVKQRRIDAEKRYEEKRKESHWYRLEIACDRIAALKVALQEIIAECPKPKLPYGIKVVEIAKTALATKGET